MLVLTRKPGEAIIVNDNIRITVVELGNGRVKIGIEAPANVSIDRQEVHDRKNAEVSDQPTIVADKTPTLHNRIADKLPPAAALPVVPPSRAGRGVDPRKAR